MFRVLRSTPPVVLVSIACAIFPAAFACVGDDPGGSKGDAASDAATTVDAGPDARGGEDAAGDAPVEATTAWTPQALGNLVVAWLDADKGVTVSTGKVAAWNDQSSFGNHAQQASASEQPALEKASANGHDAIAFSGPAVLFIDDDASL